MNNILESLYPYQKDAVFTTFTNIKGIICLPTGTGKTFIQSAIIANDIAMHPNQHNMYVVNAPRILLTYQLLKEVYGFLVSNGIEARYMFVHSGGKTEEADLEEMRIQANVEGHNIPFSEIGSTTSTDGIKDMMKKSKEQDLPLIIFSTYNSAEKIETARKELTEQPISIILNDESHYLVQQQFHDILETMTSSRCYFFTATTIYTPSDKGRGMNNKESYGEILYKMTPREAIDLGKMVRPRIHIVNTSGVYSTSDYDTSISRIIKESFIQHEAVVGTKIATKMLVSVKGTQDMINFLSSDEYDELRRDDINIFTVSSNLDVGNDVNGEKYRRQDFLKILKEVGDDSTKKAIVLHYDILAEGIDVSGFTGTLPLRTLLKSKFLQTYGRCGRVDLFDKLRIQSGEITPDELDKMNKPYAYVIIPNIINSNEDDKENFKELIGQLRDYGFSPTEDIISSSITNGVPEIEELEGLNDIKKNSRLLGEIIEEYESDIEKEEDAKLSKKEWLLKNIG